MAFDNIPDESGYLIEGRKGGKGGGKAAVEAPNTYQSEAVARIIDLISSGEIEGWADIDPLKCIFLDGTPIRNSDGTDNFKGITIDYRVGTPDQDYIDGFNEVGSVSEVNIESTSQIWPIYTVVSPNIDAASVVVSIPALTKQNKENGDLNGYFVSFVIESQQAGSGSWVVEHSASIAEKFTSANQFQYRVGLRGKNFPVSLRLRRTMPDAEGVEIQNKTYLAFVTEIIEAKMSYPGSAVVGTTAYAKQFGDRIPARTFYIKGLKCLVPANYDPVNRVYATSGPGTSGGVWDGSFKIAWTRNPAFILLSALLNADWGMGDVIGFEDVDTYAIYEIGRYCDESVPDGYGGTEPRYTFDAYMQSREEAAKALQSIAAAFQGMLFASSSWIMFSQDRPKNVARLVTNANVIGGNFVYEGFAREARHSQAVVTWNDPTLLGKPAIDIVDDPELINRLGVKPIEVFAYGTTSRSQARRIGRWTLFSEKYETRTVTFRSDINFADLNPGDVVKIADSRRQGIRYGGRLIEMTSSTSATLDMPITIENGATYYIWLTLPDNSVVKKQLALPAGEYTDVTWLGALGTVPQDETPYIISSTEFDPPLYRILGITELGGREPHLEFVAIRYYEEKFDVIEQMLDFEPNPEVDYDHTLTIRPPVNGTMEHIVRTTPAGAIDYVNVVFQASESRIITEYRYMWRYEYGEWNRGSTLGTNFTFPYVAEGFYQVAIYAVGPAGKTSLPLEISSTLAYVRPIGAPGIAALRVYGNPDGVNTFGGRTLKTTWSLVPPEGYEGTDWVDPYFRDFEIQIRNLEGDVLATYYRRDAYFEISAEQYKEINGEYSRTVVVAVRVRDTFGSDLMFASEAFTNPPPVPVSLVWDVKAFNIKMLFTPPADTDYAGVILWVSSINGFVPGDNNKVWHGPGNPVITTSPLTVYYLRWAMYDEWGLDDIVISNQIILTTTDLTIGDKTAAEWQAEFEEIIGEGSGVSNTVAQLVDSIFALAATGQRDNQLIWDRTTVDEMPIGSFVLNEQERTDNLVTTMDLIGVKTEDGLGFILDQDKVLIDDGDGGVGPLVQRFTQMELTIGDATSQIVDLQELTTGHGQRFNLLGATNVDSTAWIMNMSTVKVDATTSMSQYIEGVRSQIGTSIATYDSQIKTWVNSSSSAASWISNIQATFGTNLSSVTTTQNAVAGISGRWAVVVQTIADGRRAIGGIELTTGASGQSSIVFYANNWGLVDPNGGNPIIPFAYEGGTLYIKNAWAERLRVGSASRRAVLYDPNTVTLQWGNDSQFLDIGALWYGANGGDTAIHFMQQNTFTNGSVAGWVRTRILVNGAVYGEYSVYVNNPLYTTNYFITIDDLAPGSHLIQVQQRVTNISGTGSPGAVKNTCTILVNETFA